MFVETQKGSATSAKPTPGTDAIPLRGVIIAHLNNQIGAQKVRNAVILFCCLSSFLFAKDYSISIGNNDRMNFVVEYYSMEGISLLNVNFYGRNVSSSVAESILRHNLEAAVILAVNDKEIMATAWQSTGDDERIIHLTDGDHLVYVPKERKIKTWNEYKNVKRETSENRSEKYFVEYEEHDILVPPAGQKFATVKVVFQKARRWGKSPSTREEAYRILVMELEKAVVKQKVKYNTSAYAYIGKRDNPAGRKQISDKKRRDAAKVIMAEYDSASNMITSRNGQKIKIPQ